MSKINYLDELEAEAIYILREVAGQFDRPDLLFSGGKDSICLVHLALKAFRPGKFPFPLVHVDTGHNAPEVIAYRDQLAEKLGEKLIVRKVEDTIKERNLQDGKGKFPSRNGLQTYTLLDTIEEFEFWEELNISKELFFNVYNSSWMFKDRIDAIYNLCNDKKYLVENYINRVSV